MKSRRRHELRTNELAQWIADLPRFWRKNARVTIYIAVVAIVVAGTGYFKWYQKRVQVRRQRFETTRLISRMLSAKLEAAAAALEGGDASENLLKTAFALDGIAQQTKDDTLACLALIKQGEALRAELHYRAVSLEPEAVRQQIGRARGCYQRAQARAGQNVTLRAMAKFGLGLCAEELNDIRQAEQIYKQIAETKEFQATVFSAAAKERLKAVPGYSQKFFFAKTPPPGKEPWIKTPPDVFDVPVIGDSNENTAAAEPDNG